MKRLPRDRMHSHSWTFNGLTVRMTPIHMEPTQQYNGRRRIWRLLKPFKLEIVSTNSTDGQMYQSFILPIGFKSDFASMPLLSQIILGGRDDFLISSLIHDYMCDAHLPGFMTNATMRIVMAAEGIAWWRRVSIFYTLMLFGYSSPIYRMCGAIKTKLGL